MNQHTTAPLDFAEDLSAYEAAGVSAVGLVGAKIEQFGRERALECFAQSRLSASSFDWITGFTGANGYSLDDTLNDGAETLRLAAEFGASTVVAIAGPRNGHTWNHADDLVIGALAELGDYAERLGIHVALMPMGPAYFDRWSYVSSLQVAMDLVKRTRRDHVGVVVNTAHVFRERGLPQLLVDAAHYVRLVRLSDCSGHPHNENDQRWLGQGVVPVTAIAAALDRAGYDGYYEIDVWSQSLWKSSDLRALLNAAAGLAFGSSPPPASVLA